MSQPLAPRSVPQSSSSGGRPSGEIDARFAREALPCLDRVHRYALALTDDEMAAETLTERTFVSARREWSERGNRGEARLWLLGLCRNLFTESMSSSAEGIDKTTQTGGPAVDIVGTGRVFATVLRDGLGDLWSSDESSAALGSALARLPEPCRSALMLIDVEALSYESAAELLGISIESVRACLFRGRRTLQELLLERVSARRSSGIARSTKPLEGSA